MRARGVVVALVLVVAAWATGCGESPRLAEVGRPVPSGEDLADLEVRRGTVVTSLARVIHPELRTVLVVEGRACTWCQEVAAELLASSAEHRYSVINLVVGDGPLALRPDLATWQVSDGSSVGVDAATPGAVVVVTADGDTVGRWTERPAIEEIVAEATWRTDD